VLSGLPSRDRSRPLGSVRGRAQAFFGSDVLIDKSVVVGVASTWALANLEFAGCIMRNCLLVMPNVPRFVVTPWSAMIGMDAASECLDRTSPTGVYNCTLINLLNDTNRAGASMPLGR
jgi:hypothetical protein